MTQYTPNYRIPYPEAGDPIGQGYLQMQALAVKVDEALTAEYGIPSGGGTTPPPPEPTPNPVPEWKTTGMVFKDNGNINLGIGGAFRYRWRVDRGLFQVFFDIRWGTGSASGGGPIRITLPTGFAGPSSVEAIGTGQYWSAGGNFARHISPVVQRSSSEIRFLIGIDRNNGDQRNFQIWNGTNGVGTGVPTNTGFTLDANNSSIIGSVSFPIL